MSLLAHHRTSTRLVQVRRSHTVQPKRTGAIELYNRVELRVELSPDICMRRRTRCSVTTAPDDGSRVLEKLSLQQALEGAQRQFGGS